ncbi:uL15 family ribosomal protein [Patescibacteria group bacterium]|nr:uL15 family ribosomal protein [Patescibacteria group bacterium]MBU1673662.1 uL15 family ribosomal protein [Patescibacteria group bacterium]MBU1963850.1 uL15 family ribosomal protein [Patescibacteria group bacterium]
MLNLSNIKKGKTKKKRRVGRGNSSGAGTYSGRGQKGQRSRSGGKGGLKLKGLKETVSKLPKSRGFTSPNEKLNVINLADLEKKYKDGESISLIGIKVLGQGEIKKKLTVKAAAFSKSAEEAIINAGGKITKIK